jgi:hypothetical protein
MFAVQTFFIQECLPKNVESSNEPSPPISLVSQVDTKLFALCFADVFWLLALRAFLIEAKKSDLLLTSSTTAAGLELAAGLLDSRKNFSTAFSMDCVTLSTISEL